MDFSDRNVEYEAKMNFEVETNSFLDNTGVFVGDRVYGWVVRFLNFEGLAIVKIQSAMM